jgi:hypothetical protein
LSDLAVGLIFFFSGSTIAGWHPEEREIKKMQVNTVGNVQIMAKFESC